MILRKLEQVLLVWQGPEPIPDAQWHDLMRRIADHAGDDLRMLVVTEGGAPSPPQLLALARVGAQRLLTAAVVSDNVGMSFVSCAVAMLVKRIQTFRVSELSDACAFLKLSAVDVRAAEGFVREQAPADSNSRG
jgi:hypothetical protein